MTTTETPTFPLESYPERGAPGPAPVEPDGTLRVVRRVLLGIVLTLVVLAVLARIGVQVVGLWSPPPDTGATIDPLVTTAGLVEQSRTTQDGAPAFGHASSVDVDLQAPSAVGGSPCVLLYRVVVEQGWASSGAVTPETCEDPSTNWDGSRWSWRTDSIGRPGGPTVGVSWDADHPEYGLQLSQEEELDG